MENKYCPIGIFDSGYGGLSIFKEIIKVFPENDFVYLGDNARTPYGTRSFNTVYEYTQEAVNALFNEGCWLIILACNTASSKALRSIQQIDLPEENPEKRVLGVIRPIVEVIKDYTSNNHIGVFGTEGTVNSNSYVIEIEKLFPEIVVTQEACPMWVPLVENNEYNKPGADYFIKKHIDALLNNDPKIDSVILGCTHYPFLIPKITEFLPKEIKLISQDKIVAKSLEDYLLRHPEINDKCSKSGMRKFYTSGSAEQFNASGAVFLEQEIFSEKIVL